MCVHDLKSTIYDSNYSTKSDYISNKDFAIRLTSLCDDSFKAGVQVQSLQSWEFLMKRVQRALASAAL